MTSHTNAEIVAKQGTVIYDLVTYWDNVYHISVEKAAEKSWNLYVQKNTYPSGTNMNLAHKNDFGKTSPELSQQPIRLKKNITRWQ